MSDVWPARISSGVAMKNSRVGISPAMENGGRYRLGLFRRYQAWSTRPLSAANVFPPSPDASAMVRPTIRRKNLHRRYFGKARELARAWSRRYRGIEAIMLTGGVARGYADEHSEIDLTVFLSPATYRSWVRLFRSPLVEGDNLVGDTWVDTHLTTIAIDRERTW